MKTSFLAARMFPGLGLLTRAVPKPKMLRIKSSGLGGLLQLAMRVPAALTDAVLVYPIWMLCLDGLHNLMTYRRPLSDDVSVKLDARKGFGANRTRAFDFQAHTIFRSTPRTFALLD
jgi:hypothetical protein